jgi:hypothetical protein
LFETWDDLQEYKKGNPNLKQVITGGPAIVGGVGNRTGLGQSGGFNEMLSKVAGALLRLTLFPSSDLGCASATLDNM